MKSFLVAQVPTLTPLPPGEAVVDIGPISDLWPAVQQGQQVWGSMIEPSGWGQIIQVIIIIALVLVCIFILYKNYQKFIRRDAEE